MNNIFILEHIANFTDFITKKSMLCLNKRFNEYYKKLESKYTLKNIQLYIGDKDSNNYNMHHPNDKEYNNESNDLLAFTYIKCPYCDDNTNFLEYVLVDDKDGWPLHYYCDKCHKYYGVCQYCIDLHNLKGCLINLKMISPWSYLNENFFNKNNVIDKLPLYKFGLEEDINEYGEYENIRTISLSADDIKVCKEQKPKWLPTKFNKLVCSKIDGEQYYEDIDLAIIPKYNMFYADCEIFDAPLSGHDGSLPSVWKCNNCGKHAYPCSNY